MDLFLIRHGESYNNALTDISQRVADPPLTERGRDQARRLAAYLGRGGHLDPIERDDGPAFDRIYCSPMRRALQTAQSVSAVLGMEIDVWVDIHEVGGLYLDAAGGDRIRGPGRGLLAAEFPGMRWPDQVGEEGWWAGGQETAHAGRGRAMGVAASLRDQARAAGGGERPGRVAIVTHGDFMSALIKALADHLPSWGLFYAHANTAITRFQLDTGGTVVHYLNRVEHLNGDPARAGL